MATTSPDNLWSPDSPDDYNLVIDWAASMDSVQEALNRIREYTDDTGWLNLVPVNSFTANPAEPPQYRKIGNAVYLRGQFYRASAPSGREVAAVLPSGFLSPRFFSTATLNFASENDIVVINIGTGGEIRVYCEQARTSDVGYPITGITFLVN